MMDRTTANAARAHGSGSASVIAPATPRPALAAVPSFAGQQALPGVLIAAQEAASIQFWLRDGTCWMLPYVFLQSVRYEPGKLLLEFAHHTFELRGPGLRSLIDPLARHTLERVEELPATTPNIADTLATLPLTTIESIHIRRKPAEDDRQVPLL